VGSADGEGAAVALKQIDESSKGRKSFLDMGWDRERFQASPVVLVQSLENTN
jgi:hypothetical protein